jgi:predicted amidohydrolase
MLIGMGQFAATPDKPANLKTALSFVDQAADAGVELVVLPETSIYLDMSATSLMDVAEPLDGEFIATIAKRAAERSINVIVGTTEQHEDGGRPYNTTVSIDSSGTVNGFYRKIHLYDAFGFQESASTTPGPFTPPLMLDFGELRMGVFTCYDLRFPESARRLVDEGANVLIMPACWAAGPGKEYQWSTMIRSRAIENTAYVVAANQTGPVATGHSLVIDPMGVAVAGGAEAPALVLAELDPARVAEVRARVPSLANRRFAVVPKT